MKPTIDSTEFGAISINGKKYSHDVIIRLDGQVKKRKKKLSKAIYGTSHVISKAEAEHVYEEGAECLIIGTGQYGMVKLSPEAEEYLSHKNCHVEALPSPDAVRAWNDTRGSVIALFHITC